MQLFVVFSDVTSQPLLREAAEAAMGEAVGGQSPSAASEGYLQIYLLCNLLYLVWMAALFTLMRRRFAFRGLF